MPGIYESQVNGIFTYDIRFVEPQVAHTLEHFMACYFRTKTAEEFSSTVLYVGPMDCLTGFYLLTSCHYEAEPLRKLVLECMEWILGEEEIPGASELTCGNYRYFNLEGAKVFIRNHIIPNFISDRFSSEYPFVEE